MKFTHLPLSHQPTTRALAVAACILSGGFHAHADPGDLDLTFNSGSGAAIGVLDTDSYLYGGMGRAAALLSDNKVMFVGTNFSASQNRLLVHRYLPSAKLDTSFGTGGKFSSQGLEGWATAIGPGGKVAVGGLYYAGTTTRHDFAILRLTPAGVADRTFGTFGRTISAISQGYDDLHIIHSLANGKVLTTGISDTQSAREMTMALYTNAGVLDNSFGGDGIVKPVTPSGSNGRIEYAISQPDNKIVVAIRTLTTSQISLARYLSNGTLDPGFGTGGIVTTVSGSCLALQPDNKLVVVGNGVIERYLATGVPDITFGGTGSVPLNILTFWDGKPVAFQPNGRIVVVGAVDVGPDYDLAVARYNSDGSVDSTFGTDGIAQHHLNGGSAVGVHGAVRPDGKIVILGYSDIGSAGNGFFLARLLGDKSSEASITSITPLSDISATINGIVKPNGYATTALLHYGTTKSYGTSIQIPLAPNNDNADHAFNAILPGLSSDTTYYFSLVATNQLGSQQATGTFKTLDTVSIASPIANASINGTYGGSISINGTSVDPRGTQKVQVSLNGGEWIDANLVPNAQGADYSLTVNPLGGLNTLQVRVMETDNQFSPVETVSFTYIVKRALSVIIQGSGTVTGQLMGETYQVGKSYTLTAKPGKDQVFDGWTGPGLGGVTAEVAKLTFVFTNALADTPTITAKFISNPFLASVIGSFNGLAKAEGSVTPSVGSNGLLSVKVTATGTFTGTLKIDGLSFNLSGLFSNLGGSRFGAARTSTLLLPRTAKPALILALNLDMAPAGTQQITGTLSEQTRTGSTLLSLISADRAAFDGKTVPTSVPADYLANKGLHTIALPAQAQTNGLTSADFPQGDGHGSITITKAGVVTMIVSLADNTTVTISAPLGKSLNVPLFAQLYTNKGGCLGGEVILDKNQPNTDLSGNGFFWFKPYLGGQHYPYGWAEGVTLNLIGARYAVTPGTSVLAGLGDSSPNAVLTFNYGALTSLLTKTPHISKTNVVTKVPATDSTFTLALAAASGKITGSFTHTDGTKPTYSGVLLQKGSNARGFGYFLTTKPKVIDGTGLSGQMKLSQP